MDSSIPSASPNSVRIWPIIAFVLAQVAIYIAFASYGFEFTDEAFYLLNAMHWRDFTAVYTMFGAYAQVLMELSGGNLAVMRIVTLVVLSGCAAFLGQEIQKHANAGKPTPSFPRYIYWCVGAAAGMYYFGVLSTLRAPSYNTIALSAAALATGLLLRGIDSESTRERVTCSALYGFVMGICGLSKGSTGFLLGCLHLAYFIWACPAWKRGPILQILGAIIAGLFLQLALVTLSHPGWWTALQAGAKLFSYDSGDKLGGMLNAFRWDIQRLMPWSPFAIIGLAAWGLSLRFLIKRQLATPVNLLAVLATAGAAFIWLQKELVQFWWPAALVLSVALLLVRLAARIRPRLERADRSDIALGVLLFSIPFAFSFGTNMPVLWHSQSAALFVILFLVLLIERLWQSGNFHSSAAVLSLCVLCLPPLVFQLRAVFDPDSVYRLADSLVMQKASWATPVGTLSVDGETREALANLQIAARQGGLKEGEAMMDLTGDGPGLTLVLSGHPVGVPWLVGGYPNSTQWAERLIQSLPSSTLQKTWLLTSPDNPRAIIGWQSIITKKLGTGSHELVATAKVRSPSKWGEGAHSMSTLYLWRPRSAVTTRTAP